VKSGARSPTRKGRGAAPLVTLRRNLMSAMAAVYTAGAVTTGHG
jgi:hypothetical protein